MHETNMSLPPIFFDRLRKPVTPMRMNPSVPPVVSPPRRVTQKSTPISCVSERAIAITELSTWLGEAPEEVAEFLGTPFKPPTSQEIIVAEYQDIRIRMALGMLSKAEGRMRLMRNLPPRCHQEAAEMWAINELIDTNTQKRRKQLVAINARQMDRGGIWANQGLTPISADEF